MFPHDMLYMLTGFSSKMVPVYHHNIPQDNTDAQVPGQEIDKMQMQTFTIYSCHIVNEWGR